MYNPSQLVYGQYSWRLNVVSRPATFLMSSSSTRPIHRSHQKLTRTTMYRQVSQCHAAHQDCRPLLMAVLYLFAPKSHLPLDLPMSTSAWLEFSQMPEAVHLPLQLLFALCHQAQPHLTGKMAIVIASPLDALSASVWSFAGMNAWYPSITPV